MNSDVTLGVGCGEDRSVLNFFVGVSQPEAAETLRRRRHAGNDVRHFAWFVSSPPFPALGGF